MLPSEDGTTPPLTPLLAALIAPPATPPDSASVTSTQMAALLFTHLLRGSPDAKAIARTIVPSPLGPGAQGGSGAFFVPADHGNAPAPPPPAEDDDEPPQSLLQILAEHLSLAFLARRRTETSEHEAREWDRLVAGYVCLLTQWLWEEPGSVRDFIEAGALGMLVEPINGTDERDVLVPALCVFLLGVVYEFNREPGEATRATIHPILTRLGVDTLVGRMARLREDERFKAVSPDSIVLPAVASTTGAERRDESEVWFDWPFVDFWKSNYCMFVTPSACVHRSRTF
jgi:intracellular protein transport protein USO1